MHGRTEELREPSSISPVDNWLEPEPLSHEDRLLILGQHCVEKAQGTGTSPQDLETTD